MLNTYGKSGPIIYGVNSVDDLEKIDDPESEVAMILPKEVDGKENVEEQEDILEEATDRNIMIVNRDVEEIGGIKKVELDKSGGTAAVTTSSGTVDFDVGNLTSGGVVMAENKEKLTIGPSPEVESLTCKIYNTKDMVCAASFGEVKE